MTSSLDEHRSTWASVVVLCTLFVMAALSLPLDDRMIDGASVWAKPMKFAASFALHLATLAMLAQLIAPRQRRNGIAIWCLGAASLAAVVEVLYIYLQSARGRGSHFNFETWLETVLYYQLMGGAALVVIAATIGLGIVIARHPKEGVGKGLYLGAVLGLIVGSVATLVTAGAMASGALTPHGRWIGGDLTHASGLPIVGWSTTGGDLRVPHFFATHIIQLLPITGWLMDRLAPRMARATVALVLVAALAAVTATFLQAIDSQPFIGLART